MKAVIYRRYGPSGVLEYTDVPEPTTRDNQLLVRVRKAGYQPTSSQSHNYIIIHNVPSTGLMKTFRFNGICVVITNPS